MASTTPISIVIISMVTPSNEGRLYTTIQACKYIFDKTIEYVCVYSVCSVCMCSVCMRACACVSACVCARARSVTSYALYSYYIACH